MEITDWNIKYEPKSLVEMILNPAVRNTLGNIFKTPQNVTLYGAPGVGKGTFTNIFIKLNGCFDKRINASKETGIDTIREKVSSFANAANPTTFFDIKNADGDIIDGTNKNLKVMVFNEAESLSPQAQAALRELIEQVENRCKFIFMTNDLSKIDDAILSRCPTVEISNAPMGDIIRHVEKILNAESISYDGGSVSNIVQRCYPDIRRTVKEIQNHCNGQELIVGDTYIVDETVNSVLLDLRLYLAYHNIDKKGFFDQIEDELTEPLSRRQFYFLVAGVKNKVSEKRQSALISYIQENIPVKDWLHEYFKQQK